MRNIGFAIFVLFFAEVHALAATMPVSATAIKSWFGPRFRAGEDLNQTLTNDYHYGVDFAATGNIMPAESGTIENISVSTRGYGISVQIKDADNNIWLYGHMFSSSCVNVVLSNAGGAAIRKACNGWLIFRDQDTQHLGNFKFCKEQKAINDMSCPDISQWLTVGSAASVGETVLGVVGDSGSAEGVHLHLERIAGGTSAISAGTNPLRYINLADYPHIYNKRPRTASALRFLYPDDQESTPIVFSDEPTILKILDTAWNVSGVEYRINGSLIKFPNPDAEIDDPRYTFKFGLNKHPIPEHQGLGMTRSDTKTNIDVDVPGDDTAMQARLKFFKDGIYSVPTKPKSNYFNLKIPLESTQVGLNELCVRTLGAYGDLDGDLAQECVNFYVVNPFARDTTLHTHNPTDWTAKGVLPLPIPAVTFPPKTNPAKMTVWMKNREEVCLGSVTSRNKS